MSLPTRETIQDFFAARRIAVIGASRSPHAFGRQLVEALRSRGYDVFPVNPSAERIGDLPCLPSIAAIAPEVTTAFVVVPPAEQAKVAEECARSGLKQVWIHGRFAKGAADPWAIRHCQEAGIQVITGCCPFLFMPGAGFPHSLHRAVQTWLGGAPR